MILHKPRGVVSTMSDPEGRQHRARPPGDVSAARVYPVGRLDFDTSGVLLVTNDGDFSVALMHPRRAVPKTYVVKVQGVMDERDVDRWRRGVELEDGKTLPAKVKLLRYEGDKTWLELTITEGRNQQMRRMGDATGFRVMRLARLSFAGVGTEGLRPGSWRYLTADELATLKKDYGVPKRVVSPPKPTASAHPRSGPPGPRSRPRPARLRASRPSRGARATPAVPEKERDRAPSDARHRARATGGLARPPPAEVREDWGGGIQRGGGRGDDRDGGRTGRPALRAGTSAAAEVVRGRREAAAGSAPARATTG